MISQDKYLIEISNENIRSTTRGINQTTTTHAIENSEFRIGSIYIRIESRPEPLVYVIMEKYEFSIGIKHRKHSLKFYTDRILTKNRNYDGLLGFGLSHSYKVIWNISQIIMSQNLTI